MLGDAEDPSPTTTCDPDLPGGSQVGPRLGGRVGEALDRHHPAAQPGQDGGLEPQPGAELKDPLAAGEPRAATTAAIRLGCVVTCPCEMFVQ
jgi:hypothetical protein